MNRAHPKHLSRGHCFVCLAVLVLQGSAAQWTALFVSCALYIQKKACGKGQTFATKLQLAAALLDPLPAFANLLVVVVGDGAYAKQAFVQPVCKSGKHVCSRLRRDGVFYDLPPARRPGQKGAPRKYGDKRKAAQVGGRTRRLADGHVRPVRTRQDDLDQEPRGRVAPLRSAGALGSGAVEARQAG